jgi:hypothetical protein
MEILRYAIAFLVANIDHDVVDDLNLRTNQKLTIDEWEANLQSMLIENHFPVH